MDPLEIIREAVPTLKPSGPRWRGLCPFHNERTPSFYFMPEKGLWHCFGACNEGGDIFKFVMHLENLSFPESLRLLADRAGLRLEWEKGNDASSRDAKEREDLLDILEEAAGFYQSALRSSADAEPARRHLAQRKIRPEIVEKFRLGYSPRNGFLDAALKKGVPIEILLKAGLAVRSEKTGRYHDPLRDRLIFPITDPYGHIVGFGGRILNEEGPKYINSPETRVYTKGRQLYGLFHNRVSLREKGTALLVEGYMDVIGLHQGGFPTAVAPLGTAFTKEQAQLLKRYAREVVLLFDPDDAGMKASGRSAETLLAADVYARVARLPDGKDPDDLILEKGPEALEEVLRSAKDVVDFWLDDFSTESFSGLHGRVRRAEEILRVVKAVPNEILRSEWIKKISRRLSLDEESLRKQVQKDGPAPAVPTFSSRNPAPAAKTSRVRNAEEETIQLLCLHPEAWPSTVIPLHLFFDLRCRGIWEKLQERRNSGKSLDVAGLSSELSPEDGNWFSSLLMEGKQFPRPEESMAAALRKLEIQSWNRQRRVLEAEVLQMMEGKRPRDEEKISTYHSLTKALKTK